MEEVDQVFAERTEAEVQTQIEKTLVDMLQLGNSAASNGIGTSSARSSEKLVIELFSSWAAMTLCQNILSDDRSRIHS